MSSVNVSEKSWTSAFEGLKWKADAGAQFMCAGLLSGTSIQVQDFCTQQKVSELWNKVIIDKDSEAMVTLGHVYMRGFESFQCKYSQALELFCQAADANNSEAFMALLRLLSSVDNTNEKQSEFVFRIERAAESKNPGAMFCLGVLLDKGICGVSKDKERAKELISEAAALGNSSAMLWIGGKFTKSKSSEKAISWFNKAINAGNKAGYCQLGKYYFIRDEDQKALETYQKGADQGDLGSTIALGNIFDEGAIIPKNDAKAIALYQKGAAGGIRDLLFKIAQLHKTADRCKQAAEAYEKALSYEEHEQEIGNMLDLAELYYQGGPDLPIDEQKGYYWLSRAARQQFHPKYISECPPDYLCALSLLIQKVERGQGCPKDKREVQRLKRLYNDGIINLFPSKEEALASSLLKV